MFTTLLSGDFYPRPPRGGRRRCRRYHLPLHEISIHALREEGDFTPGKIKAGEGMISIHALREEGDICQFYPHRR